jgi:Fur family ferric uptake transcriptional regulator
MNEISNKIDEMLQQAGIHVTKQRRIIMDTLLKSYDHPTAHDLYNRIRFLDSSVSFATIYRTLSTLSEAGIVERVFIDDGAARFEITAEISHDHLVDVDSGEVFELVSKELFSLRSRLAAEIGYEIISQHSVLEYVGSEIPELSGVLK